jgi:cytochrome oxidase assembly protein ShyY1
MKPRLVPTAFMIFGVCLTWSLGFWQLDRHHQKSALREAVLQGLDAAVLDERGVIEPAPPMYRKIEVVGSWDGPEALMAGRKEHGKVGYGLVQPFVLADGTRLLVDRGWVPRDGLADAMNQIRAEQGPQTLRGQLRPVDGSPGQAPLPAQDTFERWPPGSWPALWERLPDPKIHAVVLAGEPILVGEGKDPTRLPVDGYHPLPRTTDSLSYAFQWWIFGGVLIVVWVFLSLRRAPSKTPAP